ncbi:hypothetical protein [Verrucomicrobium spinosum]|uniref:hypothetical protein n=1 Tax=Verrucomicrobium spinosum TaxID=2736 RepID=UPI00017455C4|nr:hypothetical protein [Verrucomicrobium spinosum]
MPPDRALTELREPTSFEVSLTSARAFTEEKLGDLKHWELNSVQEFNSWQYPDSSDQPKSWKDATARPAAGRIFWFTTKDAASMKLAT